MMKHLVGRYIDRQIGKQIDREPLQTKYNTLPFPISPFSLHPFSITTTRKADTSTTTNTNMYPDPRQRLTSPQPPPPYRTRSSSFHLVDTVFTLPPLAPFLRPFVRPSLSSIAPIRESDNIHFRKPSSQQSTSLCSMLRLIQWMQSNVKENGPIQIIYLLSGIVGIHCINSYLQY